MNGEANDVDVLDCESTSAGLNIIEHELSSEYLYKMSTLTVVSSNILRTDDHQHGHFVEEFKAADTTTWSTISSVFIWMLYKSRTDRMDSEIKEKGSLTGPWFSVIGQTCQASIARPCNSNLVIKRFIFYLWITQRWASQKALKSNFCPSSW